MSLQNLPVIRTIYESGADDRVFDSLLLAGPIVVLLIAALGRTLLAEGLAIGYVTVFVGYVLYRAVRR